MKRLDREQLYELLGSSDIPGTPEQIKTLAIRIGELVTMNGKAWVRQNGPRLLDQWHTAIKSKPPSKSNENKT